MKTGFVVLGVTGSRWWWDAARLRRDLDAAASGYAAVFLHHGACPPRDPETGMSVRWDRALKFEEKEGARFLGADWLADRHAEARGWFRVPYPADWSRYGKRAGMVRNDEMVQAAKADIWLGFPLPGSRGTVHCLERAALTGAQVRIRRGRPR